MRGLGGKIMRTINSLAASIVIGLLAPVTFGEVAQIINDKSANDILERRVAGSDLLNLTTTDAFSKSLAAARVPGGIARILSCEDEVLKQAWRPLNSPLRAVLDSIVLSDPRYRWQLEDGVVNLIPVSGEPALLQVRVTEFHVENAETVYYALSQLIGLPEVKKGMAELQLSQGLGPLVIPSSPRAARFTVHCQDVTLREALNAIVRAQGRAVWLYTQRHCSGGDEINIEFTVQ